MRVCKRSGVGEVVHVGKHMSLNASNESANSKFPVQVLNFISSNIFCSFQITISSMSLKDHL